MKNLLIFLTVITITALSGCHKHTLPLILNKVENLMCSQPDSAYALLASINTDTLDTESFARWCMLKAELSHRASNVSVPSIEEIKTALNWYQKHGTAEEQLKAKFYLGMAYANEGETNKAIDTYVKVYQHAEKTKNYQLMGYVCSYTADLYAKDEYAIQSLKKRKEAALWFKKAQNKRSYVCALRDICRNYAYMDSLSLALTYLHKADSIGKTLNDANVYSSILNAYGNIYTITKDYDKAENYFKQSLAISKDSASDYLALIKLYLQTKSYKKATALLQNIQSNLTYNLFMIDKSYYLLYKLQGDYINALKHLETYSHLKDSFYIASSQSKVFEIENRYKHQKLMTENAELKLQQRNYLLIIAICLIGVLILLGIYWNYRKRTEKRLLLQQANIRETRNQMLELSIEIERKNALLERSEAEQQALQRLQQEKKELTAHYHTLRQNMLQSSAIYKKLQQLARQKKPGNNKSLLTPQLWEQIKRQAQEVYPGLRRYVINRCPDLSESEWAYCCLYLFGFDTNDEATLLGINTTSVRTKTARLRTRLHIELPEKSSLYDYLTTQI